MLTVDELPREIIGVKTSREPPFAYYERSPKGRRIFWCLRTITDEIMNFLFYSSSVFDCLGKYDAFERHPKEYDD